MEGVADGVAGVLQAVRYQIKYGAGVIKICATAGVLSFEGPVGAQQLTIEEMRAIVEEAHRHGLRVAAHAHGTEGIIAAVLAGVSSIDHGSMLSDSAIALMKSRGTYLVPTTALADLIDLDNLPAPLRAKAEGIIPLAKASRHPGDSGRSEDRVRDRCRGHRATAPMPGSSRPWCSAGCSRSTRSGRPR